MHAYALSVESVERKAWSAEKRVWVRLTDLRMSESIGGRVDSSVLAILGEVGAVVWSDER